MDKSLIDILKQPFYNPVAKTTANEAIDLGAALNASQHHDKALEQRANQDLKFKLLYDRYHPLHFHFVKTYTLWYTVNNTGNVPLAEEVKAAYDAVMHMQQRNLGYCIEFFNEDAETLLPRLFAADVLKALQAQVTPHQIFVK